VARTLDAVTQIVRTAARQLTGADGATFVLRDCDLCHYAEEDAIAPLWKGRRFPMTACISGWVMLNRQPVVIPDIYADPRIPADAYRPTFVTSLVMVPIRTIAPLGAIGNYWAIQRQASPHEVKLLQTLADTTAVALENVQVYQELEQRVRNRTAELQQANEDLRSALDRIQRLEKLVRICAWTNRLELDGEWVGIETYLKRRFGLIVTHGISEEALAEQLRVLKRSD
jgi:GAF domain-containing protein